jgi:hypothetical protein
MRRNNSYHDTKCTWDFLEFLEALIACIDHEITVNLPSKVCTKGIMDIAVWCLKLWLIMTSGFGTSLFCMEGSQNDINMLHAHWCLRDLLETMIQSATMRSMAITIPNGTN